MLSLNESNNLIIKLLESNEPFYIARLGYAISVFSTLYDNNNNINNLQEIMTQIARDDGIYHDSDEIAILYAKKYNQAIKNCDAFAIFPKLYETQQNYYIMKYNLNNNIYNRILEPFYCCLEDIKPWSLYLKGKRVLIISPFIKSFQEQLNKNFQIFKDKKKKIFADDQEFLFYKSFQCLNGNKPHKNWLETFLIMCKDIKKLDFDIALLGCGGYGLPLCYYIKTQLKKSAIYVGGGLQLLFGVMGNRWINNDLWKNIIKENDTKIIRPSGDEKNDKVNNWMDAGIKAPYH